MKVLILNTSERTGGAAVAANRLAKALTKKGLEVSMLVRDKKTDDPRVVSVNDSWMHTKINLFRFYFERLCIFLMNHLSRKLLFTVSIANTGTDISSHSLVKEADIIHLHWINQGFLSLADIRKLEKLGKPIVWTMHDMWPSTAICHHARECENFQEKCEACPFLQSRGKDISTWIFQQKLSIYNRANLTFVTCSEWLKGRASKSLLLRGKQVLSIPNPIDTTIYSPKNKEESRNKLGLPLDKKLILFGALNVTDKRKGIDYLVESLRKIQTPDIELVVFGQVKADIRNLFPVPIHPMGYLSENEQIAQLYNAVDMFVTSSLEENLPNTIMESMACGTPCVGFEIGGIPEMIDHKVNGYVATYKDSNDLASGIDWVIKNADSKHLKEACICKVQSCYNETVVANRYIQLYESLLQDAKVI